MTKKELIRIYNLEKQYALKPIFSSVNLSIHQGDIYGVLGKNGAGKSTLFRMILGLEEPDAGIIQLDKSVTIGYIAQEDQFDLHESSLEYLARITQAQDWEIYKQALQFDLSQEILHRPIGDLSGGYGMRIKLIQMLLAQPNLILLDEPTNYLDLSTILLLENWIKTFSGTVLLITHDREFLRRVMTATIEVEQGNITIYPAGIDEYLEYKQILHTQIVRTNSNIDKKQAQLQQFIDRFGAKASKAAQAKSKQKQIQRLSDAKKAVHIASSKVRMFLPNIAKSSGMALDIPRIQIGYHTRLIAEGHNLYLERGQKVAVLGDNGQGKSTLLKTLSGELSQLGGQFRFAPGLKIGYFAQSVEFDNQAQVTVYEYLRHRANIEISDDTVKKTLGSFLFSQSEYDTLLTVLSGGEKARLRLAAVFLEGYDVLILDEPTNHLDLETVEIMAQSLVDWQGTLIFVSHDRSFVDKLATVIWEVKNGTIRKYPGKYSEYIWSLEQTSHHIMTQTSVSSTEAPVPIAEDKSRKRELYQARKEVLKIDKKIAELKEDVRVGVPGSVERLAQQEALWIKVMTIIDSLSD